MGGACMWEEHVGGACGRSMWEAHNYVRGDNGSRQTGILCYLQHLPAGERLWPVVTCSVSTPHP